MQLDWIVPEIQYELDVADLHVLGRVWRGGLVVGDSWYVNAGVPRGKPEGFRVG